MEMKRDHYEDVGLINSGLTVFWFVILILLLGSFPLLFSKSHVYIANYMAINIIVALGINLLTGCAGQISLGHAGFFAIGAFGTIVLMVELNFPFLLALPAAALMAALSAFLLGLPTLRLKGPFLAIVTLGFGLTVTNVIGRIDVFGGTQGLQAPELIVGPWHVNSDREFFYLLVIITVLLALAAGNIVKTKAGRAFAAIRDSEIAAEGAGVNLSYYKTLAFTISAFYTGIAGGLCGFLMKAVEPAAFTVFMSILFLVMVVVGGRGSIFGSIAGACVLSWLHLLFRGALGVTCTGDRPDLLSGSWFSVTGAHSIQLILFGLLVILVMVIEPKGLFGLWTRAASKWKA